MSEESKETAYYHLPGLYEFYELYKIFLPLYREHREYFYDWCQIGSIYGSPADCLWGGGRVGFGYADTADVIDLLKEYRISARLTFSNSLIKDEHLTDAKCNELCRAFERTGAVKNGIIITSDRLLNYLMDSYPEFYYVSSTTKVITDFECLRKELEREEFSFVVPDFRFNKQFDRLDMIPDEYKDKIELLCNECCQPECKDRQFCYEVVSRKNLGDGDIEHICPHTDGNGYQFSKAMDNPCFIGTRDIVSNYLSKGFSNFKIEGRGLGSALILEFLLYYMTKPQYHIRVREAIYLDSMLDLF